ncbi:hypothetical protein CDAR_32661 [Caerostris darwini]|uniref:Uncharacterized protein n=1 Tax=Caerostris darwini TaxID=1538125 RepID=A0AAV4RDG9_9ARAC|nr:hypothetical protein CDAR_32661 [Caerostris darwini]
MDSDLINFEVHSPISSDTSIENETENVPIIQNEALDLAIPNQGRYQQVYNNELALLNQGGITDVTGLPTNATGLSINDQRLNRMEEMLYNSQLQLGASTSQLQQGASTSQLQQGASTSQLQQGASTSGVHEHESSMKDVEFQRQKEGRPSTTRNEGSQTFRPRRALELKPNVLKRAGDTFDQWAKCLKTEGDVEKLALLTEEEYDVIRRIIEIGETVAENKEMKEAIPDVLHVRDHGGIESILDSKEFQRSSH